jgi:UDP-N-acetylmuramyl pentapeptide synthase
MRKSARRLNEELKRMTELLWTGQEMADAMARGPVGACPTGDRHIHRQPDAGPGDAFFAIKGDNFDGHDFASVARRGRQPAGRVGIQAAGARTADRCR